MASARRRRAPEGQPPRRWTSSRRTFTTLRVPRSRRRQPSELGASGNTTMRYKHRGGCSRTRTLSTTTPSSGSTAPGKSRRRRRTGRSGLLSSRTPSSMVSPHPHGASFITLSWHLQVGRGSPPSHPGYGKVEVLYAWLSLRTQHDHQQLRLDVVLHVPAGASHSESCEQEGQESHLEPYPSPEELFQRAPLLYVSSPWVSRPPSKCP